MKLTSCMTDWCGVLAHVIDSCIIQISEWNNRPGKMRMCLPWCVWSPFRCMATSLGHMGAIYSRLVKEDSPSYPPSIKKAFHLQSIVWNILLYANKDIPVVHK